MDPVPQWCNDSTVALALSKVGLSSPDLTGGLGTLLTKEAFLAGSLAAGLGNVASDVDVYVIDDSIDTTGAPLMFFVSGIKVDVQHFTHGALLELLGDGEVVTMRSLGVLVELEATGLRVRKRISRWQTALPIGSATYPLSSPQRQRASARLVAGAFGDAIVSGYVACSASHSAARVAWARAGRALLEVENQLRRDHYVGGKWVWTKARRNGVHSDRIRECKNIRSLEDWNRAWRPLGLERPSPEEMVSLAPSHEPNVVEIGGTSFVRVGDESIVSQEMMEEASASPCSARVELLSSGTVVPRLESLLFEDWLRSNAA